MHLSTGSARRTLPSARRPGARLRLRSGLFTRAFARRVGENGQVYAVDLQQEMLGFVKNLRWRG